MRTPLVATLCTLAAAAKNETYAVLAYGRGGGPPCFVLGSVLKRVDPGRSRTALVYGVSDDARAALRAGGWAVAEAASFKTHRIDGDAANDLGKATAWPGRKLDLWRLPYDKVLYLDADTMLVDHAGTLSKSLAGLWALPLKKGEIGALSNGAGCFNGGMLLLRPAASTFGAYEAALAQNALKKTCEGHDQPLLNHVFDGAWTDLHKKWRLMKVTQSCDRLEHATPDAVHFSAASAPWRGGCRACLAENKACSHRHGLRDAACAQASLLEAQRRWWREVDALPAAARRFVDGLLEDPPTRADGSPRRLCSSVESNLFCGVAPGRRGPALPAVDAAPALPPRASVARARPAVEGKVQARALPQKCRGPAAGTRQVCRRSGS